MKVTPDIAKQAQRWLDVLASRSGVSTLIVLAVVSTIAAGTIVAETSSDAAKSGTAHPGLGGHFHGFTWRLPLHAEDVAGPFEIAIAVLEFAALAILDLA